MLGITTSVELGAWSWEHGAAEIKVCSSPIIDQVFVRRLSGMPPSVTRTGEDSLKELVVRAEEVLCCNFPLGDFSRHYCHVAPIMDACYSLCRCYEEWPLADRWVRMALAGYEAAAQWFWSCCPGTTVAPAI